MQVVLSALLFGALIAGVARAEEPAAPTAGDRVAGSGAVQGLKRFSDRMGSGVGGALDSAGRTTGRAGAAVNRGFDAFDGKMTGWMGKLGFKPLSDEERRVRQRREERKD